MSSTFVSQTTTATQAPSPGWEAIECPLCGIAPARVRYVAQDWRYGSPGTFHIVECGRCSLAYLSPRPVPDEILSYYPENYPAHDPSTVSPPSPSCGIRQWVRDAALSASLDYPQPRAGWLAKPIGMLLAGGMRRRLWPYYRPGGRVLDVGCGRGDYIAHLRESGWRVWGIDINARAVEQARNKGLEVFQGTLVDLAPRLPGPFDVVTFFDSFEHHHNPLETLSAAHSVLRRAGELLIEFPNYGSPWRTVFGRYWADLSPPQHFFHYTAATLTRMAEKCGFRVEAVTRRPSGEIRRSVEIFRLARGQSDAVGPRWAAALDVLLGCGHLLLRARRSS